MAAKTALPKDAPCLSPLRAYVVPNHILEKLDKMMLERVYLRHKTTSKASPSNLSIPIVRGYMDGVKAQLSVHNGIFFEREGVPEEGDSNVNDW